MRTLCLLGAAPADLASDGREMVLVRALQTLGAVDVIGDRPWSERDVEVMRRADPDGRWWAPAAAPARHRIGRLRWVTARRLPLELGLIDRSSVWRGAARFIEDSPEPYDVVWADGATASWRYAPLTRHLPLIIDVAVVGAPPRPAGDRVAERLRGRIDHDRWARFDRGQGARANLVTVVSDADREALGVPGALVLTDDDAAHGVAPSFASRVHTLVASVTRFDRVPQP